MTKRTLKLSKIKKEIVVTVYNRIVIKNLYILHIIFYYCVCISQYIQHLFENNVLLHACVKYYVLFCNFLRYFIFC